MLLNTFHTFVVGDNSTSDHTAAVDPEQLIGPQVIDMIMNKPGIIRWFKLCYLLF